MIIIIDILIGIFGIFIPIMLLWAGWWIIKLLGIPFSYVAKNSYLVKMRDWLSSQTWIREFGDIIMLIIVCAIMLFVLFSVGQLFTGKP